MQKTKNSRHFQILDIDKKVDEQMKKVVCKNKTDIDTVSIKSLFEGYNFDTIMLALFIGGMGSGKTYFIIRHILVTENILAKPYYNLICYCSTSDELDKTVDTFKKQIKTPIIFIPPEQLMNFLQRHIKRKKKFYSMVKYINSGRKVVDKTFRHSVQKHK